MTAVVTLCIGKNFGLIGKLTHSLFKNYAEKIQADFHIIRQRKFSHLPIPFEKYQLFHLLKGYDRVLFLDTDVVVRPDSPNIFDIVPEGCFGAYLTNTHSRCHDKSIEEIQKQLPDLTWKNDYFNSGVMVLNREHKSLFNFDHGTFEGFYEQTQLNYNLQKLQIPLYDITYKFNHVELIGVPISKRSTFFIHYAGPGHGQGPKHYQIAKDFPELRPFVNF